MNTQEKAQLDQFLTQLVGVKLAEKNSEAQSLISDAVARQPDAAYLLVQRCLLQDQALQTAQKQIAELQNQLQQKSAGSAGNSFLNGDPWSAAAPSTAGVPGAANYRIANAQSAPSQDFARPAAPNPSAGLGSSFLGNVATTAAGVVAGSFLFQGIESLMGHHASTAGWGQQAQAGQTPEQTITNNYYGDNNDQLANNDDNNDYLASDDSGDYSDDGDSDWG